MPLGWSDNGSIIWQMTKSFLLPVPILSVTPQEARATLPVSPDGFTERLVLGTVAMQPERSLVTIRESDLWGHLRIRFKCYQVKQSFLLYGLRQGNKISAVFSTKQHAPPGQARAELPGVHAEGFTLNCLLKSKP